LGGRHWGGLTSEKKKLPKGVRRRRGMKKTVAGKKGGKRKTAKEEGQKRWFHRERIGVGVGG